MTLNWGRGLSGLGQALAGVAARKAEEEARMQALARDDARWEQQVDWRNADIARDERWRSDDLRRQDEATLTNAVRQGFQPIRPGERMGPIAGEHVPQVVGNDGRVASVKPQAIGRALASVGGQRGVFDPTKSEAFQLSQMSREQEMADRKELARFEEGLLSNRPVDQRVIEATDGAYSFNPRTGAIGRLTGPDGNPIQPRLAGGQSLTPLQQRNVAREQAEAEILNLVYSGGGATGRDIRQIVEKYPDALSLDEGIAFARQTAERRLPGSGGGVVEQEQSTDDILRELLGGGDTRMAEAPQRSRGAVGNPLGRGTASAEQINPQQPTRQQGNATGAGAGQPRPSIQERMADLKRGGIGFDEAQRILRAEGYIQ